MKNFKVSKKTILAVNVVAIFSSLILRAQSMNDAAMAQLDFVRSWAESDRSMVSDSSHMTQALLHKTKTSVCVLIMHGLHESPAYMNGLSQFYYSQGANVISLRLPGHQETNPQNINNIKAEAWINAGEMAFQNCLLVGEKVELFGYSTGGTVATYLALSHPKQTQRLVLMAPALALDKKVLFSTLALQFGSLNSQNFCSSPRDNSFLCQIFKSSDPQLPPMVKEGLVSSPAAGFQVQRLIVLTLEKFFKKSTQFVGRKSYENLILDIYMQLQTPLIMINSEIDNVVDWKFNQYFYNRYNNAMKKSLLFPENEKISHIHINKPLGMGFRSSPEIYNHRFEDVLRIISAP